VAPRAPTAPRRLLPLGLAGLAWGLIVAAAHIVPAGDTGPTGEPLSVALIQGNIPQDEKFQPGAGIPMALEGYAQALRASTASLVVAPETAIPLLPSQLPAGYVEAIAAPKAVRVIPLDIYDYSKEINLLKTLPKENCVGIVSLSSGIGRQAEVILHGLRGDQLLVMTSQPKDAYKLQAIVKRAEVILSDQASYAIVQAAVQAAAEDIIRPPKLIKVENYIGTKSINLLKLGSKGRSKPLVKL
jgi:hypothetical protein